MTFAGDIVWRGERGYEEARVGRVFNGRRPERYPGRGPAGGERG